MRILESLVLTVWVQHRKPPSLTLFHVHNFCCKLFATILELQTASIQKTLKHSWGFIATGERVRLDQYFLDGPAINSPAKQFQVSNSDLDQVELHGHLHRSHWILNTLKNPQLENFKGWEVRGAGDYDEPQSDHIRSIQIQPFQIQGEGEYYGNVIVHEVDITLVLPVPLMTGQSIEPRRMP